MTMTFDILACETGHGEKQGGPLFRHSNTSASKSFRMRKIALLGTSRVMAGMQNLSGGGKAGPAISNSAKARDFFENNLFSNFLTKEHTFQNCSQGIDDGGSRVTTLGYPDSSRETIS